MTDTERLAALLHEHWLESPEKVRRPDGGIEVYAACSCGEWVPMPLDVDQGDPVFAFSEHIAACLVAAGVRVGEGCPSCGAPRSGCNDCGWKPEQPIVALAPVGEDVGQEIHDATCPDCAAPSIDPDRLARALARRTDRTDAWVLLPKEMQDLWRKDAAAIVKAYEEEG